MFLCSSFDLISSTENVMQSISTVPCISTIDNCYSIILWFVALLRVSLLSISFLSKSEASLSLNIVSALSSFLNIR